MKRRILTAFVLLAFIATSGCGARRRIMRATARAQVLPATAAAGAPTATGIVLFQDDFEDGQPDDWRITASWTVRQEGDDHVFGSSAYGGAWVLQGFDWSDYEMQALVRVAAGGVILNIA